jgi:glycosyltransferase involved in cell wall biosynthesis
MKIAIIHPKVTQGGAEKIVVFFSSYLKEYGHDVDVITLCLRPEELDKEFIKNTNIIAPTGVWTRLCKFSFIRKIIGFPVLYFMLRPRINKYDVVHANNFPSHWVAGLLAPGKTVWQCNEPPMKVPFSHIKSIGIMEYILSFVYNGSFDRSIVKKIAAIVVLDKMNADRIRKKYNRPDAMINHIGIDEYYFKKPALKSAVYKKNLFNRKDRYLICAGNLVHGKNQQLLIKTMKLLKDGGIKNVKMILVGRGPDRSMLESLAGNLGVDGDVVFKGFVTNEELRDLYSISDINLFAAVNQSWGLTPFEAAAQGTVSIVSDDCGAAEIIKKYRIGIVTEPLPEKFAMEISLLLKDRKKRMALGVKAESFVRRSMTWEKYTKNMIKVFEKIAKKGEK